MSKIYEALLRAEQERAASTNQPQQAPDQTTRAIERATAAASAVAVEELPATTETVTQVPTAIDQAHAEPRPYDEPAYVEPVYSGIAALTHPTAPLDMKAVRSTVWKPMLDKLPALEERGNAVEQFRSLRTRLFGFRDLNKLKSILISSALPREGKSFIAANLAISFARHKASRVLLIDGDMRRSSLHALFGCEQTPGLTTYLAGHASLAQIMQNAAVNDDGSPLFAGLGSLTFIGGGEEGDKAADLSGSGRFKKLIEEASPYFDWIIVDSSPVNLVTDGVNLATACDAVLMVARGGVTKFEAAQRALGELKSSKILGVVLNAVDRSPQSDGYYGYDGYDLPKNPTGQATQ